MRKKGKKKFKEKRGTNVDDLYQRRSCIPKGKENESHKSTARIQIMNDVLLHYGARWLGMHCATKGMKNNRLGGGEV